MQVQGPLDSAAAWQAILAADEPLARHKFASEDMRQLASLSASVAQYIATPPQATTEVFPEWVVNNPNFSRSRPAFEGKSAAEVFKTPVLERTPQQTNQAIQWLQSAWHIARKIGIRRAAHVVARLNYARFPAGATIFSEGEHGEEFYLILSGAVGVIKQAVGKVAILGPGHSFGELALTMHATGRTASCVAEEDSELLTLHKRDYEQFALDVHFAERRDALACLTQCPMFSGWKHSRVEEVCNLVHRKVFIAGEYIYRQGEEPDFIYVILEGEVDVIKEEEKTITNRWPVAVDEWQEIVKKRIKSTRLKSLTKPQCFGELAIIGNTKRPTSTRARTDTTVLTLDKNEFAHLMRPKRDRDGFEHVRILAEDGSYEDEVVLKVLDTMLTNMGEQVQAIDYVYSDLFAWSREAPATMKPRSLSARETGRRPSIAEQEEKLGPLRSDLPIARKMPLQRRHGHRLSTNQRYLRSFQAKLLTSTLSPSASTVSSSSTGLDTADSESVSQYEPTVDELRRRTVTVERSIKRVYAEPSLRLRSDSSQCSDTSTRASIRSQQQQELGEQRSQHDGNHSARPSTAHTARSEKRSRRPLTAQAHLEGRGVRTQGRRPVPGNALRQNSTSRSDSSAMLKRKPNDFLVEKEAQHGPSSQLLDRQAGQHRKAMLLSESASFRHRRASLTRSRR